MKDYAHEIETAKYLHLTDTIMVTINEYETDEYYYLLTHIIIDDPSQIHAGLSNDDYGGSRETPTSAAERLGWVVGINGSNFSYVTNTPTMADISIKNSQVMPDSKMTANGMEICLTNSGNLFSPQQGMTASELLAMGVTDTWCCGDTLLISNGQAVNVGIQSEQYRYPRTAIGMVRPCEYYIITAGNGGYNKGMTYDEIRDTLMSRDCGFGKCLDGGGSSSLVFEKQLLNKPAAGSERPVTDFLYFTE
jgi:exopolysaccharide biosynthesis protein